MRLFIAIYDPATITHDNGYWVWRHPGLAMGLLESFFNNIAAVREPTGPLPSSAVELGFAAVNSDWCAWYRFYYGGDIRRKRYLLACAFARRSDLHQCSSFGPWDLSPFAGLVEIAPRQCPLPNPAILEIQWSPSIAQPEPTLLTVWEQGGEWIYEGSDYVQQTMAACAMLPTSQLFHCHISQRAVSVKVSLSVKNASQKPQSPVSPSQQVPKASRTTVPEIPQQSLSGYTPPDPAPYPQRGNIMLRYPAYLVILCILCIPLSGVVGFWLGRSPERNSSPPVSSDAPRTLSGVEFLQHLLDHAEKLTAHFPVKPVKPFQKYIDGIRSDLARPDISPDQLAKCRRQIDDLFGELFRTVSTRPTESSSANFDSNRVRSIK